MSLDIDRCFDELAVQADERGERTGRALFSDWGKGKETRRIVRCSECPSYVREENAGVWKT